MPNAWLLYTHTHPQLGKAKPHSRLLYPVQCSVLTKFHMDMHHNNTCTWHKHMFSIYFGTDCVSMTPDDINENQQRMNHHSFWNYNICHVMIQE